MDHQFQFHIMDVAGVRQNTPGIRHGNGAVHMAASSSSLAPTAVSAAVSTQIEAEMLLGGHRADDAAAAAREDAYDAIAALLRCQPEEVALVSGAAEGWRCAVLGLDLHSGDRILLSAAESDAARIACIAACAGTGATLELLPTGANGIPDLKHLEDTIDYNVKLVAMSHVAPGHGVAIPAAAVGAITRRHGVPFLLDVTQTVGQLELDANTLLADIITASGSSYLRGPRGTGLLCIRNAIKHRLSTRAADASSATLIPAGMGGAMSLSMKSSARRFETHHNGVARDVGLGVAARYADAVGIKAVAACITKLADQARLTLSTMRGVTLLDELPAADADDNDGAAADAAAAAAAAGGGMAAINSMPADITEDVPPAPPPLPTASLRTGIVPFVCTGVRSEDVAKLLADVGTIISVSTMRPLDHVCIGATAECSDSLEHVLQLSMHYYNTEEEVARVCSQIADIIDAEDPDLDEWESIDCPASPRRSRHSSVSSSAAGIGSGGRRLANLAAFGHGFDGLASRSGSISMSSSISSNASSSADDGNAEAAMDGLSGLGASVVNDDRLWVGSNSLLQQQQQHQATAGHPASAAVSSAAGTVSQPSRTVMFPLLAGIPRRGLLGTAPLLFDGSPPAMWDAPVRTRNQLFYQPSADQSHLLASSAGSDLGGIDSASSVDGDGDDDDDDDDAFEDTQQGAEMFLNGICCNDEELDAAEELEISKTPTNSSTCMLSPKVGFASSETASSLDSGLEIPATSHTRDLPEGHTLLRCARGPSSMPYPI